MIHVVKNGGTIPSKNFDFLRVRYILYPGIDMRAQLFYLLSISILIFNCHHCLHTSKIAKMDSMMHPSLPMTESMVESSAASSMPRWTGQPMMLYYEILMLSVIMFEHSP